MRKSFLRSGETPGELLIIGSGSGEMESLAALVRKAKKNERKIGLVTADDTSETMFARHADLE